MKRSHHSQGRIGILERRQPRAQECALGMPRRSCYIIPSSWPKKFLIRYDWTTAISVRYIKKQVTQVCGSCVEFIHREGSHPTGGDRAGAPNRVWCGPGLSCSRCRPEAVDNDGEGTNMRSVSEVPWNSTCPDSPNLAPMRLLLTWVDACIWLFSDGYHRKTRRAFWLRGCPFPSEKSSHFHPPSLQIYGYVVSIVWKLFHHPYNFNRPCTKRAPTTMHPGIALTR